MLDAMTAYLTGERIVMVVRAVALLIVGLVAARLLSRIPERFMAKRFTPHHLMIGKRFIYYGVLALFVASALSELGFGLHVFLGAAGILSVALGFASQTSASNLISGLFLIGERPFAVGDVITVGNTTGEVLSIDLLSVKLRTFDNLYVRIPNETLIKSEVTTLTRFPIRRLDLAISVAYKEDIARVREILMKVAEENPLGLDEPKPLFIFKGFGNAALNIQFSVWAKRDHVLELSNSLQEGIKRAFDAAGIEISSPQAMLFKGDAAQPFPVRVVKEEKGQG
jgi:small-conductance mechanosensitive channel